MYKLPALALPLVVAAVIPGALSGQEAPQAVVEAIQAIEDDWARAYQTKDGAILERILGEEFYVIGWDGKRHSREDEIRSTVSATAEYSRVTNTVIGVRQYGDVLVADGQFRAEGTTSAGDAFQRAGTWQAVFTRRDGRWVAVAGHTAPLPD